MVIVFCQLDNSVKRIDAKSFKDLKKKAELAFKRYISRYTVKEDVLESGQKITMEVDLDSDDHFQQLQPGQLIHCYAPMSNQLQSCMSNQLQSAADPPTLKSTPHVESAVPLPKGTEAPIVSLSKFEYAPEKSSPTWFFDGYASPSVHATMLRDYYRTHAYAAALKAHADTIRGKVVMDIGTGTGIWALTAARLGAKRVIAVEATPMAKVADANAAANGLSDRIDVLHATVEELVADGLVVLPCGRVVRRSQAPPGPHTPLVVDVIVSEWMGYWLLTEGVLPSVLLARDTWLRPGTGRVLPSHCAMFLAPFEDIHFTAFWDSVYGLDMRPCAGMEGRRDWTRRFPSIEVISSDHVIAPHAMVKFIDCNRDPVHSVVEFTSVWQTHVPPPDPVPDGVGDGEASLARANLRPRMCHGFVGSFSVFFDMSGLPRTYEELRRLADEDRVVELTTRPPESQSRSTHWYHTLLLTEPFLLDTGDTLSVRMIDKDTPLQGFLSWRPNQHEPRYYNATIRWSINDQPPQERTWEKC